MDFADFTNTVACWIVLSDSLKHSFLGKDLDLCRSKFSILILEQVWVDVVNFHKTFDNFGRVLFDVEMECNYQVVRPVFDV